MATATSQKQRSGRRAAPSSKDALAILKADHQVVEKLFVSFEKAGDRAYKTKRRLVDEMIEALSVHAFIEEQVLYPAARSDVASTGEDVLEAIEEHHIVKWELQELLDLDPTDERFAAKVTVLTENVRHHVKEEERSSSPSSGRTCPRRGCWSWGNSWRRRGRWRPGIPIPACRRDGPTTCYRMR